MEKHLKSCVASAPTGWVGYPTATGHLQGKGTIPQRNFLAARSGTILPHTHPGFAIHATSPSKG